MKVVNEIRKKKKKDKWKEGNVRQLFEEEGYELAVIDYMKQTGIGYRVEPEERLRSWDTKERDEPPFLLFWSTILLFFTYYL